MDGQVASGRDRAPAASPLRFSTSLPPTAGGILMIVASYFSTSAWVMSLICLAIAIGVYVMVRQG